MLAAKLKDRQYDSLMSQSSASTLLFIENTFILLGDEKARLLHSKFYLTAIFHLLVQHSKLCTKGERKDCQLEAGLIFTIWPRKGRIFKRGRWPSYTVA